MFPSLILLNNTITSYSISWLIGIFLVGYLACRSAKRNGIDENDMIQTLLVISIGVVFGGHLLYGLTNFESVIYIVQNLSLIDSIKKFVEYAIGIFGGAVFYGGLFGGLLVGYKYLKNRKLDTYIPILIPLIPLFHCFGRIGCFLSGCCFGIQSNIGFTYHYAPNPAANGVVRFPVQLIEAILNFFLFVLLTHIQKKGTLKNHILSLYLIIYAFIRFFLEFLRGDLIRGVYLGLSVSQYISIIILIIVPIHWYLSNKKSKILCKM